MNNFKQKIKESLKDSHSRELVSKASFFIVFKLTGLLFGYVFLLFIARKFGASVNGLIALSLSIFMMTSMLGRLGTDILLVKFFSDDDNFKSDSGIFVQVLIKTFLFASAIAALVFVFRDFIAIEIFKKPQLTPYIFWTALSIPFWVGTLICGGLFRARKRNNAYAFINNAGRFSLATLFLLLLFYCFSDNPLIAIKAHFFAVLCLFLGSVVAALKSFRGVKLKSPIKTLDFFKESFPMMISSTILVFLGWMDTFILGIFKSDDIVGVYTITLKIAALTSFSLEAINSILAPKIALAYKKNDLKNFKKMIRFSTKLNFFITLLMVVGIIVFHTFLLKLFGKEFLSGAAVLIILCVGQFINSFAGSVGVVLQMTGHQNYYRNIVFLALLLNLVLNFILTPNYGAVGVAIATIASMVLWKVLGAIYLRKKLDVITYYNFR